MIEFRCLAAGEAEPRPGREPCLGKYSVLLDLRRGELPSALVWNREGRASSREEEEKRRERGGAYRDVDSVPYGVKPLEGGGVAVYLQEELISCTGCYLEAKQPVRVWRQALWLCELDHTSPGRRSSCWTCPSSSQSQRRKVVPHLPCSPFSDGHVT